jgi:putative peptidoglycan binding protein
LKGVDLKARRTNMDALCSGDLLFVPGKAREGLPLEKGVVNRYVARVPKVTLTLRLRDGDEPMKNEPYVVHGLAVKLEGTTDGEGSVSIDLPIDVHNASLELPRKRLTYHIAPGHMDCIQEDSGVRMRLANLGLYAAPADAEPEPGALAEAMRTAILRFQKGQSLEATGVLDDATRAALADAHGS